MQCNTNKSKLTASLKIKTFLNIFLISFKCTAKHFHLSIKKSSIFKMNLFLWLCLLAYKNMYFVDITVYLCLYEVRNSQLQKFFDQMNFYFQPEQIFFLLFFCLYGETLLYYWFLSHFEFWVKMPNDERRHWWFASEQSLRCVPYSVHPESYIWRLKHIYIT